MEFKDIFIILLASLPLLYLLYILIIELLDLIFNSNRINKLLQHSDSINIEALEKEYQSHIERQSHFDKSNLKEMRRQLDYTLWIESKNDYTFKDWEKQNIKFAKELSDIFKVK